MVKFEINAKAKLKNMALRAGTITDGGLHISTPTRALNVTELNHGKKITDRGLARQDFPHELFEINKFMKPEIVIEFINDAEVSASILKQIKKTSSLAGNRFTIFHPVINKKLEITDEMNIKLIELQLQADIDLISIMDNYNGSVKDLKKRIKSSFEQIKSFDTGVVTPMLTIKIDSDEKLFVEKLELAAEEGIYVINPSYNSILENYENYLNLMNFVEKHNNIWIHMSEVPRKLFRTIPSGHVLPLFGIDTFALDSKPVPIGLIKRVVKEAKRFDRHSLRFLTAKEHIDLYGDSPKCNCFVENRDKLSDVMKVYQVSELLSSSLSCHEAVASHQELNNLRMAILEDKSKKYLLRKESLLYGIKRLLKTDLAQEELI